VSPKNKGKFGKGKPAIEPQDEFVSGINRVLIKLKPFAKQLLIGGIVVLVAVVAGVGWNMYAQTRAARASELYAQALVIYGQPVMSAEEAELIKSLNLGGQIDFVTHATPQERAQKALVPLEELRSKYGSTDAAAAARLLHAGVLLDAERYDDAADMYRAFAGSDAPAPLRALAREGIGYAIEAKALATEDAAARQAGLEAALAAFGDLQREPTGPMRDHALFHQARVLQSLGRTDEAIAKYNEVLDTQPTTSLRRDISSRLAVIEAPADATP
jgi:hypothetical protein